MSGFFRQTKQGASSGSTLTPNVGQYGWTLYESQSVSQIIGFVNETKGYAVEAATSANNARESAELSKFYSDLSKSWADKSELSYIESKVQADRSEQYSNQSVDIYNAFLNVAANQRIIENFDLTVDQTVVAFTKIFADAAFISIHGQRVDNASLMKDLDYSVTGVSEITLKRRYPLGTKLSAVQDIKKDDSGPSSSESAAIWNRKLVQCLIGISYGKYYDHGRDVDPRLVSDGIQYLPRFDTTDPVIFSAAPIIDNHGDLHVETNKGQRVFSRVAAEAVSRADLNGVSKGVYSLDYFGDLEVDDHRVVIQKGLDYVAKHGGSLVFPPRTGGYVVKSAHPDYPGHGLVLNVTVQGDKYTRGGISLVGYDWNSRITLGAAENIESLLYIPVRTNYLRMSNMWLDANKKSNYGFLASDEFNPFMTLEQCKFYNAKSACARISTYVSQFTGCFFGQSDQDGLRLVGIGSGPVTSVTLTGCYAVNNTRRGFDFGYLTYCTLNSCAADRNELAYYFNIASGVVMNGCGAETCGKGLQVAAYRGFALNTFYMLSVGSADAANPEFCLVEFGSGYGATVQGIRKESSRYQQYFLASTAASTGNDNITVLDGSVTRDTAYWVPSTNYIRPIKFIRGDQTESKIVISVTSAQQLQQLATRYSYYGLDHDVALNLAVGDYDLTNLLTTFESISGAGTLSITGSASNPTGVRIITNHNKLRFSNISARLYLKDLVITGSVANNGYKRLTLSNCSNVFLDRVVVQKGGINVGVGIENISSNISMFNNSGVDSTSFATGPIVISQGGSVSIEDLDADPTNAGWFVGAKYYTKTPTTGSPLGKVWVSAAAGWKPFGTIE